MVQELRGRPLGNVAFLVNLFRDVVSLLMIPLVSRRGYALLGVTAGGVSSMDILAARNLAVLGTTGSHLCHVGRGFLLLLGTLVIYLIAKGAP
jgi:uncharacterized membrane protein YbjE (DUF340 family)